MGSVVETKLGNGTSRSGRLEAPPLSSEYSDATVTPRTTRSHKFTGSKTRNHRSESREGKKHKVKSNHGARSRDSEGSVASSHICDTNSSAPPRSTMSGSTLTPTTIHTHTSTVSRSSVASSQISNTSSSESETSVFLASTTTSLPDRPQVSTGSRAAEHRSNNGKGREYEIRSDHDTRPQDSRSVGVLSRMSDVTTQKPSNHGSGIPEAAEEGPYLVPVYSYGVTNPQRMVPRRLIDKSETQRNLVSTAIYSSAKPALQIVLKAFCMRGIAFRQANVEVFYTA
ncbi:hypothetical protein BHYA_0040g00470 [Botrytis hyacinthi]|uniref:Uncharacterized protein n=1 Tax=Botrytis hyacinthi TaxID=278943 RepID=A0A4Z1GUU9_9HELO|nr:hypothetical protein BHYA_0040g00470 [Botrytis hyacinthi]